MNICIYLLNVNQFGHGLFSINTFSSTVGVERLWTKQWKTYLSIKLYKRFINKWLSVTKIESPSNLSHFTGAIQDLNWQEEKEGVSFSLHPFFPARIMQPQHVSPTTSKKNDFLSNWRVFLCSAHLTYSLSNKDFLMNLWVYFVMFPVRALKSIEPHHIEDLTCRRGMSA